MRHIQITAQDNVAIALQDLPEGLAVAISLRAAGLRNLTAGLIGAATGWW